MKKFRDFMSEVLGGIIGLSWAVTLIFGSMALAIKSTLWLLELTGVM
jgi:hypothetical protein